MELREINFLKRFWSVSGGYILITEYFLSIVSRQIQAIRNIQRHLRLGQIQANCCITSLHDLISIANSLNSIMASPVVPNITSHLNELFDDYETVFLHSSRKIIGLFKDHLTEYETMETFLKKIVDDPTSLNTCKVQAIDLVSKYIEYIDLICRIIEKNGSQGRYIGLSRNSLYSLILELHSILTKIKESPMPINLTTIEGRYSDQFYNCIRLAQLLIDNILNRSH